MKQFKGIFKHLSTYRVRGALLIPCLAMVLQLWIEWIPIKEKNTDSWLALKVIVALPIPPSDHKVHKENPLFLLQGLSLEPNFKERISIFGGGLLRKRKVTFFQGGLQFLHKKSNQIWNIKTKKNYKQKCFRSNHI